MNGPELRVMPSGTAAAFAEKSVPLMERISQKERDAARHVAVGAKPGATAAGPLDPLTWDNGTCHVLSDVGGGPPPWGGHSNN